MRYVERSWRGPVRFALVHTLDLRRFTIWAVDEDLPFGGHWEVELAPAAGGTRVAIWEEGEIRSPLLRAFSHFVVGYEAALRRYLADLKTAAEL